MKSRWPTAVAFAVSMLALGTLTGLVSVGDTFGCALLGQFPFGPACVSGGLLVAIAGLSFVGALLLWPPSRPEHRHDAAPDEQRAAGHHGDVERGLEERR